MDCVSRKVGYKAAVSFITKINSVVILSVQVSRSSRSISVQVHFCLLRVPALRRRLGLRRRHRIPQVQQCLQDDVFCGTRIAFPAVEQ